MRNVPYSLNLNYFNPYIAALARAMFTIVPARGAESELA
jgi:hypothetical protein